MQKIQNRVCKIKNKHEMKGTILTLIMSLPLLLYGQQSPVSGGGDAAGSGGTVSYSIGQVAYMSKGVGPSLNEGVQQPFEVTNLPIELLYFNAKAIDNKEVQLTWETITELNNDYFTVERSANGTDWEYVGKVSGSGTTTENRLYELMDDDPYFGDSYYRLKQTDYDGTYAYSETRTVYLSRNIELSIYPNPTPGALTIEVESSSKEDLLLTYELISLRGEVLMEGVLEFPYHTMDLSKLSEGAYWLKAKAGDAAIVSKRIIKIK